MEEQPPALAPLDPGEPYALRMLLIRRYWYLTLKFSNPYISESGRHEASWNGGNAVADTESALMAKILEAMEDCGDEGHSWITEVETPDPLNRDNVLLTQRLKCAFCDKRQRSISVYRPYSAAAGE